VTGVIETLASTGVSILDVEVGASGNIYASYRGELIIYDATGTEVDRFTGGGFESNLGVALGGPGEDIIYMAADGAGGQSHILQFTVSDYRAENLAVVPATSRIDDQHVFSGDTIAVPVWLDLTNVGAAAGTFDATVSFDTTQVEFVSIDAGDWVGTFTPDITAADSGRVSFMGVNADGAENVGVTKVAELTMVVLQPAGESTLRDLLVTAALSTTGSDLSIGMSVLDGILSTGVGMWGDASGEGVLSALDALMCLTSVVGTALPEGSDVSSCDVAPDVDADSDGVPESFDGTITALDALAILIQIVELPLPAEFRAGRAR
jgi:hypothetical protein